MLWLRWSNGLLTRGNQRIPERIVSPIGYHSTSRRSPRRKAIPVMAKAKRKTSPTKAQRARGERLAKRAHKLLGDDPEALAAIAEIVRILADRSGNRQR